MRLRWWNQPLRRKIAIRIRKPLLWPSGSRIFLKKTWNTFLKMRSIQACDFAGLKTVNFRYFGKRVTIPALFHGRGHRVPLESPEWIMMRTLSIGEMREKSVTPTHAGISSCSFGSPLCRVWGLLPTGVFEKRSASSGPTTSPQMRILPGPD